MKLQSRPKLAHDRCVDPLATIARLEALIRPRHDYWLHEETLAEHLHWSAMFIDGLDFRSMGKGITLASSTAGALAEGAEWLTARETASLPGYLGAREHKVPDALPIESLVSHIATATPPVLDRIRALDDAYHWVDGYSLAQVHHRHAMHDRCTRDGNNYRYCLQGFLSPLTDTNLPAMETLPCPTSIQAKSFYP